jgi:hypothetical protein
VQIGVAVALLGALSWAVTRGLERLIEPAPATAPLSAAPVEPPPGVPRITATLFYAAENGLALVPVRREVALAEGTVPQGREILAAQLQGAPPPFISVVPPGTTLRAFYATERGDAFVDLSADVSTKHSGGLLTELMTVYAIVNAVTTNLPAVQRVQILIDGREVDTLAGHVDLRRPLQPDQALVRDEAGAQ